MQASGHINPDLFDIFIKETVYLQYAERYMDRSQIHEADTRDHRETIVPPPA